MAETDHKIVSFCVLKKLKKKYIYCKFIGGMLWVNERSWIIHWEIRFGNIDLVLKSMS